MIIVELVWLCMHLYLETMYVSLILRTYSLPLDSVGRCRWRSCFYHEPLLPSRVHLCEHRCANFRHDFFYRAQSSTDSISNTICHELQAVEAFAFLNFLICKLFGI